VAGGDEAQVRGQMSGPSARSWTTCRRRNCQVGLAARMVDGLAADRRRTKKRGYLIPHGPMVYPYTVPMLGRLTPTLRPSLPREYGRGPAVPLKDFGSEWSCRTQGGDRRPISGLEGRDSPGQVHARRLPICCSTFVPDALAVQRPGRCGGKETTYWLTAPGNASQASTRAR
jgi:hypothetical protein